MAHKLRKTMKSINSILFLSLTVALSMADDFICKTMCKCENSEDDSSFRADCSKIALNIVPQVSDWPDKVTHMDLSSNNISALDTELSQNTVEVLDLSNNKIRVASQNAFGGLKKLKYLNLANNLIKEFEEDGFYGLDHLESLNISSNGLKTLPDKLFYNFIGLRELSLADNPLVHLDPIHFNRMIALRWLDASNIEAYSLPPHIFHTTSQLEFLDLSGNEFHDVPTDALRSADSLKHLRLSENPIDYFDKKSFIKLSTLEVLEVNTMDTLKYVLEEAFSDLVHLHTLEMKHNRYLSSIDRLAFDGLFNASRPVLQELHLEENQLSRIDRGMVSCARMRVFNVQKNPLVCDCNLKWIKKCHIQILYAADLKCEGPPKFANHLIDKMEEKDFSCEGSMSAAPRGGDAHHDHVVRSVTIGMVAGFLVVLAFGMAAIFKWKDIRSWYRLNKKGPGAVYYVKARSNPREI